jgi:AraC family transcriptional regulator
MIEIGLQRMVDYIEMNLSETLSLDECAQIAGYSKFHLHRLFSNLTGQSVGAYIRERRLSEAYIYVSQGERILDVAIRFGYQSERAFSRAFIQRYGMSPSKCRGLKMLHVSPLVIQDLIRKCGIVMEKYMSDVFFETLEDMKVIASTRFSNNPEEEVIEFLTQYAKEHRIETTGRNFGFYVPVEDSSFNQEVRGYQYWLEVTGNGLASYKAGDSMDEQVTYLEIDKSKYAVLRIEDPFADPFERIPKGWQRMIGWLKDHDIQGQTCQIDKYCLEEVKIIDDVTVMDIYVPIE